MLASIREPRTTVGGVNLVSGFRPELWRGLVPDGTPADLTGFDLGLTGADGFVTPGTQHDALLWLAGSAYDIVFGEARAAIAALAPVAALADDASGWPYLHFRDMSGVAVGTENPSLLDAPGVVQVREGQPGAGGAVLLLQVWPHDVAAWEALSVAEQEAVIGRAKPDSVEPDPGPATSHVARSDQDTFGEVFRRSMLFGTVSHRGTIFVGFCARQQPLLAMLESMAGVRDALTRSSHPTTGAYSFVPPIDAVRRFATKEATDAGQTS